MALALGVAAMFFGVVFLIVGWKGQGVDNMNANLVGMLKGDYLPATPSPNTTPVPTSKPKTKGATSTTGGSNSSGTK